MKGSTYWMPTTNRLLFGLAVIALACVMAPTQAGAGGPEVAVALEAGAQDLFDPAFELTGASEIILDWPNAGFSLGTNLTVPYYPGLEWGDLELWQEYKIAFRWWWLDAVLAHYNGWIIADGEWEGAVSFKPVAYLWGVEVGLELETQYVPELGLTLVPSILYELEVMLGTASLGVSQGVDLSAGLELADTEFLVSYETGVGDYLTVTAEILPTYTADSEWTFSVALAVETTLLE